MFDDAKLNQRALDEIFATRSHHFNSILPRLCWVRKSGRFGTFPTLFRDPDYGRLARQAFEQKVSTELLDEFLEEVMPPLLADSELRPWQVPSMGRSRQGGFLTELMSLTLDRLKKRSR